MEEENITPKKQFPLIPLLTVSGTMLVAGATYLMRNYLPNFSNKDQHEAEKKKPKENENQTN